MTPNLPVPRRRGVSQRRAEKPGEHEHRASTPGAWTHRHVAQELPGPHAAHARQGLCPDAAHCPRTSEGHPHGTRRLWGGDAPKASPRPAGRCPAPQPGAPRAGDTPVFLPGSRPRAGAKGFREVGPRPSFPGPHPGATVPSVKSTPNCVSDLGYITATFCASVSLTAQRIKAHHLPHPARAPSPCPLRAPVPAPAHAHPPLPARPGRASPTTPAHHGPPARHGLSLLQIPAFCI